MQGSTRRGARARLAAALAVVCALALALVAAPLAARADDDATNVAKIGDTEYATLAAAVSAASDGDTITLIADTSASSQIKITGVSITLDLNGCTLTLGSDSSAARMLYVSSGASLTVTDSGSSGTITNEGSYSYGLIDVYGTLVIEGGTFYDQGSGDGASIKGRSGSSITINGGTFEVAYTNYNKATESVSGEISYSGNTNYFGNYILRSSYGYVSITGGTFTSGQNCWGAICLEYCSDLSGSGAVSVSGVEVTCIATSGIFFLGTDAVLSDSTVTVSGTRTTDYTYLSSAVAVANETEVDDTEVTIESGTYSAPYAVYIWNSGATVTIKGGEFSGTAVLKADAVNYSYWGQVNAVSSIVVYGGSFDGAISIQTDVSGRTDATLAIHCGDFTSEAAAGYVADTATVTGEEGFFATVVHTLEQVEAVEATCTEDGNVAYLCCTYCGDCFTATTTTDDDGTVTTTTTYAAADYDSEIAVPATGHDWDGGTVTTEATCTEDGVVTYVCRNDSSHTYTEAIAATGHVAGDEVVENYVEATCEEDGSYDVVVYCDVCGEELSRETVTVPATGHDWSDTGTVTWSEDHSSATITVTCDNCGEELTVEANVTSVTNDDGSVTYTATAVIDGTTYAGSLTVAAEAEEETTTAEEATTESSDDSDDSGTSLPATGDDAPAGAALALAAGLVAVGAALLRRRLAA